MKYFYLLLTVLLILGAAYSLFGIAYIKWSYYQAKNPRADFLIIENNENNLTIVDFVNYRCGYCKKMHPIVEEALDLHKDVRYIVRPILFDINPDAEIKQEPAPLGNLAIAAGFQGKFKEMHDMFMDYPDGIIPEETIKETAELYGLNYEQLIKDSNGEDVKSILDDNIKDMLGMNIQSIPSYIIHKNIYPVNDQLPDLKKFLTMINNEKQS